jgi:hypothetical protein
MSPRGGPRSGSGRPPSTGRTREQGGSAVYVMLSQVERADLEACLVGNETAASLLRSLGIAEVRRRAG